MQSQGATVRVRRLWCGGRSSCPRPAPPFKFPVTAGRGQRRAAAAYAQPARRNCEGRARQVTVLSALSIRRLEMAAHFGRSGCRRWGIRRKGVGKRLIGHLILRLIFRLIDSPHRP
jgi:hypothetical protein